MWTAILITIATFRLTMTKQYKLLQVVSRTRHKVSQHYSKGALNRLCIHKSTYLQYVDDRAYKSMIYRTGIYINRI